MPKTELAFWSATELLHGYATRYETVRPVALPKI